MDGCVRVRGCAVGAVVGDALGMPLEFGPRRAAGCVVSEMRAGWLRAGEEGLRPGTEQPHGLRRSRAVVSLS